METVLEKAAEGGCEFDEEGEGAKALRKMGLKFGVLTVAQVGRVCGSCGAGGSWVWVMQSTWVVCVGHAV